MLELRGASDWEQNDRHAYCCVDFFPGLTIPPATDTPDLSAYIPPYFALHIVGGHIGLPILVLTFIISKRAKRSITVINFCITWILFSVSYCLL